VNQEDRNSRARRQKGGKGDDIKARVVAWKEERSSEPDSWMECLIYILLGSQTEEGNGANASCHGKTPPRSDTDLRSAPKGGTGRVLHARDFRDGLRGVEAESTTWQDCCAHGNI
jgi:hypothetical protein